MFKQANDGEIFFIALFLEAFFYGLYSGIFATYLQYQTSKEGTRNRTQNLVFYSTCALYVLSTVAIICDIIPAILYQISGPRALISSTYLHIHFLDVTAFGCADFIAQCVLIYRCWIVWGRNIHVVIIPLILAFAYLGTWLTSGLSRYIVSQVHSVLLSSLALSLTVNVLMTGLIVFRIFTVFREVKATLDDQILGATGGSKLRRIIFILIESGMALFSIQLARLVITIVATENAYRAFVIVGHIHSMLTGITPTIIVVRTAMGLSFDDERSLEEVAIESLRFVPNHPTVSESESVGIVDQDRRDDSDDIGIRRSNDIDIVER